MSSGTLSEDRRPLLAKIHTLTYNGTKSSDLGVFVTGSGSFDAAELDVDKYEIPGRNGDLILSNNRYKNIEITYPAFIPKAFMDKAQNVRNWLRSSRVYARLEDTYDTDHYRLGIPTGVQSFEPANRNDGANFEMTFDCKPQRFLKSGETPETVEADVQTESGEIVTFETIAESPMTSAEVSLSPIQDLNGYDSPWPAGGGKNKFDVSKMVNTADITVSNGAITVSGNAKNSTKKLYELADLAVGSTYTLTATVTGGQSTLIYLYGSNYSWSFGTQRTITQRDLDSLVMFYGGSGQTAVITEMMIRLASVTDASFAPYSNICPISGHTGVELKIGATYPTADNTYSVTFSDQGTVYGGTYDFVSGKLTVTKAAKTLDGSETYNWHNSGVAYTAIPGGIITNATTQYQRFVLCDKLQSASWAERTTFENCCGMLYGASYVFIKPSGVANATEAKAWVAANNLQIVYELATPLEYTLTPQQIETLLGQNNVWSDAGPITLTYAEPFTIENPTIFDARPLFTVTNPAEGDVIMVNGQAITFVDGYSGTVFIDCETMNAYSGAANLNSIIEATDFPVLVPGTNIITWTGTGVCTMTPRWWEL